MLVSAGATMKVTSDTDIRNTNGTAMTIDGGIVNVAVKFTKNGMFNLSDGTLHVSGGFDNGRSSAPLTIDSPDPTRLATLQLTNPSGLFSEVTSITVDSVNRGALVVDKGRNLALGSNSLSIGDTMTGGGIVTVTGTNSAVTTSGAINVGGNSVTAQGVGILNISHSGSVSAGTLKLYPQATLILDGGRLSALTVNPMSGATVDFLRGRVNLTALNVNVTALLLDSLLSATHELGPGRSIAPPAEWSPASSSSTATTVEPPAGRGNGEFNGDGLVSTRDFMLLSQNFRAHVSPRWRSDRLCRSLRRMACQRWISCFCRVAISATEKRYDCTTNRAFVCLLNCRNQAHETQIAGQVGWLVGVD
jgi:hypothetical protein